MDQIILKLPDLLASVMSMGWPGIIAGALLTIVFVYASIKYKQMQKEAAAAQQQTEQAANPSRNASADQAAAAAQDSIEGEIKNDHSS